MGTMFQKKADEYQAQKTRTKGVGVRNGLFITGIGVVGFIGSYIINILTSSGCERVLCILVILQYLSPVIAVGGVIYTIVNLARPTKIITCPKCGQVHRIYRSVRKFMCPKCRELILMGEASNLNPQLEECFYCRLQTAVTSDCQRFICPKCGVLRQPQSLQYHGESLSCPSCGKLIPKEAIYCKSCGAIVIDDFTKPVLSNPELVYDYDWKIGKDNEGHFIYAQALLRSLEKQSGEIADLPALNVILERLEEMLISFEEAMEDLNLRTKANEYIQRIDLVYGEILQRELQIVSGFKPKQKFDEKELKLLKTEPYIVAWQSFAESVQGSPEQYGGIGKWNNSLVKIKENNDQYWIDKYNDLAAETERFAEWRKNIKG